MNSSKNYPPSKILDRLVRRMRETGLDVLLADQVRTVWRKDIDRYEPSELGDTPMSLGVQASVNVRTLVERAFAENPEWAIDGLQVETPQQSLVLDFEGCRIRLMKSPPAHGRTPDWSQFEWTTHAGRGRHELAEANTRAVGGRLAVPEQLAFPFASAQPGRGPRDCLVVWSGERHTALTAGWLTMPVLGSIPFLGCAPLWWDEEGVNTGQTSPGDQPAEPTYDNRSVPKPVMRMKRGVQRARDEK